MIGAVSFGSGLLCVNRVSVERESILVLMTSRKSDWSTIAEHREMEMRVLNWDDQGLDHCRWRSDLKFAVGMGSGF